MLVLSTTGGFLEGSVSEDAEVGFLIIQHSSDCLLLRWRHPVFETTWTTTPAIASVENYHSTAPARQVYGRGQLSSPVCKQIQIPHSQAPRLRALAWAVSPASASCREDEVPSTRRDSFRDLLPPSSAPSRLRHSALRSTSGLS